MIVLTKTDKCQETISATHNVTQLTQFLLADSDNVTAYVRFRGATVATLTTTSPTYTTEIPGTYEIEMVGTCGVGVVHADVIPIETTRVYSYNGDGVQSSPLSGRGDVVITNHGPDAVYYTINGTAPGPDEGTSRSTILPGESSPVLYNISLSGLQVKGSSEDSEYTVHLTQ